MICSVSKLKCDAEVKLRPLVEYCFDYPNLHSSFGVIVSLGKLFLRSTYMRFSTHYK